MGLRLPGLPLRGPGLSGGSRWCAVLTVSALTLAGCDADAPVATPGPPAALRQVSGSGQSALPGTELERPLIARVVDDDGRPIPRAQIRWRASAGEVQPRVSLTDANGDAVATWRVGDQSGVQRVMVEADGIPPIEFVAFVDAGVLPDRLPLRALQVETYDGSGQVVHPDVVAAPFGGLDDRTRLAITPYPWGNAMMENPSLFAGSERDGWTVPAGIINPIVRPEDGYLSDPDLVWDPDARELRLYYRHVNGGNRVLLVTSRDGVGFSAPRLVVSVPNHQVVSPTIVRRSAGEWLMWSVNAGSIGCDASSTTVELRRSSDGVHWSSPKAVTMTQPGVFPWHIDVQWVPELGEYWALFNGKVSRSCTTDALFLATSTDGVAWRTFRSPVLRAGAIPELADVVYRATFAYDARRDLVSLWHSGARYRSGGYEWRAAYERRRRSELFEAVARNTAPFVTRIPPAELDNETAP